MIKYSDTTYTSEQTRQLEAVAEYLHVPVSVLLRLSIEILIEGVSEDKAFALLQEKCDEYHEQERIRAEQEATLDAWEGQ